MKRKVLLLLLCVVMVASIFVASCSGGETVTVTNATGGSGVTTTVTTANTLTLSVQEQLAGLDPIQLKMTVHGGRNDIIYKYYYEPIAWWMDYLSGGKIKLVGYGEGEITAASGMLDAVGAGMVDMAVGMATNFNGQIREEDFEGGMPFALEELGYDQLSFWHLPEVQSTLEEIYAEHNVKFVSSGSSLYAAPGIFITNFPVTSLADFKGKKIGAKGTRAMMIKAMGGVPVEVPTMDMYLALDRGTVDGVIMHPAIINMLSLYEVADYFITPGVTSYNNAILMNLDRWNKLPQVYQDIISTSATAGSVMGGPFIYDLIAKNFDSAKANGMQHLELSDEMMLEIRRLVVPIWDEVGAVSPRAARLVELLKEYLIKTGQL